MKKRLPFRCLIFIHNLFSPVGLYQIKFKWKSQQFFYNLIEDKMKKLLFGSLSLFDRHGETGSHLATSTATDLGNMHVSHQIMSQEGHKEKEHHNRGHHHIRGGHGNSEHFLRSSQPVPDEGA